MFETDVCLYFISLNALDVSWDENVPVHLILKAPDFMKQTPVESKLFYSPTKQSHSPSPHFAAIMTGCRATRISCWLGWNVRSRQLPVLKDFLFQVHVLYKASSKVSKGRAIWLWSHRTGHSLNMSPIPKQTQSKKCLSFKHSVI